MAKIPWQQSVRYEETEYIACTSVLIDAKNGPCSDFQAMMDFLDEYRMVYGKALRMAHSLLAKGEKPTEIKKRLCTELKIKARIANSALKEAQTRRSALKAAMKSRLDAFKRKKKVLETDIKDNRAAYEAFRKENKDEDWHKPSKGLVLKNRAFRKKSCILKRKLDKLNRKIENLDSALKKDEIKICFGGKTLMAQRHRIGQASNPFKDLAAWKTEWDYRRNRHIFTIGSSDEAGGSQLCRFVHSWHNIFYLQIADYRRYDPKDPSCEKGKVFTFPVEVKYRCEDLLAAQTHNKSISCNIVCKNGRFYVQPILTIAGKQKTAVSGCLGLDINNGFISIAGLDQQGKFTGARDLTFETLENTGSNKTSLLTLLSKVHNYARKNHLAVAIEGINLSGRKICTGSKTMNRILHLFPYSRYVEEHQRLSIKKGTVLHLVCPAYSSVIGDRKYSGTLGISRHQSAAYVVGRRALGFTEFMKK